MPPAYSLDDFAAKSEKDRDAIRQFKESGGPDHPESNPAYRIAREHFELYLEHRPSLAAGRSLAFAFDLWRRLTGVSGLMSEMLVEIPDDELTTLESAFDQTQIWESVGDGIIDVFTADGRRDEGIALVEEFSATRSADHARAFLLWDATMARVWDGSMDLAKRNSEMILELDTSKCPPFVARIARGCIHEHQNLNIGQPAPNMRVRDLNGEIVELSSLRGYFVLLHFWNTTCPFCPGAEPVLKSIAATQGRDVRIISVSMDDDVPAVRRHLEGRGMDWPQICDGCGEDGEVPQLYNVFSVPSVYVIDKSGALVRKRVSPHEVPAIINSFWS